MLVYRSPFTRQPQAGLRLDRGNPLAKSITHCLPLNGNSAEIVTGAQLTRKSGYAQNVDSRGVSLKSAGAAASASVPINLAGQTLVAVSFWLYWDTFTNNDNFAMEFGPDINSAAGFYVDPNSSSSAAPGCFEGGSRGSGSSAYGAQFCSQPTAAAWHHVAMNFDAAHAAGITAIYIDSTSRALTNPVTATQSGTLPNDVLHLFSRNDASLFGAGRMQNLILRGGYALSAAEVLAEFRNPWQIYAPPPERFFSRSTAAALRFNPLSGRGGSAAQPLRHD